MNQTITLDIPTGLYVRLKARAAQAHRTVEDETLDLLAATVPAEHSATGMNQLDLLDTEALMRAAQSRLASEISSELESLHHKQQREGLSEAESMRCAVLVRAYEQSMLIRAHAAALLKQRGVDIAHLVAQS